MKISHDGNLNQGAAALQSAFGQIIDFDRLIALWAAEWVKRQRTRLVRVDYQCHDMSQHALSVEPLVGGF